MSVKHINYRRSSRPARRPKGIAQEYAMWDAWWRASYLARRANDERRYGPVASYLCDVSQEQEQERYKRARDLATWSATLDLCDECHAFGVVVEQYCQPVCLECAERARYADSLCSYDGTLPEEYWWEQVRRAESYAEFAEENAETFPAERARYLAEARGWQAYADACEEQALSESY